MLGGYSHIILYTLLPTTETVQHLIRRGRLCSLLYANYTAIKRHFFFFNVPREGERRAGVGGDRKEGGREELRPPNTAASHHNTRSSLPQGRLATLTTAAPSTKPQALCEKGHFTSMLLKPP